MKIPCEECILLAVCITPGRFYHIYYGCTCTILEKAIFEESKLTYSSPIEAAKEVHDWYKERTGNDL